MAVPEDEKLYGDPIRYDPTFKGPLKGRSCTDVICLLLFVVFLGGWVFIITYAITHGDLNRLLVPVDSYGRKCGIDTDVIDKKYLLFFDLVKCTALDTPIRGCRTPQVCVEKCPDTLFILEKALLPPIPDMGEIRRKLICEHTFDKETITTVALARQAVANNNCAGYYLPSGTLSNRCIPIADIDTLKQYAEDLGKSETEFLDGFLGLKQFADINGVVQTIIEDVQRSYGVILIALFVSMVVCLIFIFLMRWLAGYMVWLSILGALGMLGVGVGFSAMKYIQLKKNPDDDAALSFSYNIESLIRSYFQKSTTWLWLLILLSVILLIILLIVIFLRKRVKIAVAIIKEGSKAVSSITASVFFPIFPWIFQITIIAAGVGIGLSLASIGEFNYKIANLNETQCQCTGAAVDYVNNGDCLPDIFKKHCHSIENTALACKTAMCNFKGIQNPPVVTYYHIYNVVATLWSLYFVIAFAEMVLASTFATWYWTFHKQKVPYFTVLHGMGRTIRYHLGTIAFGSLIITICSLIRIMIEYIDQKLKKYDNELVKCLMCCLRCFFWCLEKFLKFLNKNAYIMCAIHGKNFCGSAKDAFCLLMRNCLRVVTLGKVTDFLFFLSKIMIALGMAALTFLFYHSKQTKETVEYKVVPMVLIGIGSYIIATIFFNVYSMAVDTLFLCFLEDSERNDGSEEKPYFMSKNLMRLLKKKNVVPKSGYQR